MTTVIFRELGKGNAKDLDAMAKFAGEWEREFFNDRSIEQVNEYNLQTMEHPSASFLLFFK